MDSTAESIITLPKRWVAFFAKGALLLAVLFVVALVAPSSRGLAKKVVEKAFFKAIVGRVGSLAAASATAAAAGPSAVAVAAVGSIAADIALKKGDELLNRENYKQEIIATIEEERQEFLSAVESATVVPSAEGA